MQLSYSTFVASLVLLGPAVAQTVDGSKYNNPTAGPPSSYFAAASSLPVAALQSAAAKASKAADDATYPINSDSGAAKVTIHEDWSSFSKVSLTEYMSSLLRITHGADYCGSGCGLRVGC